jgi:hypothetical protein
MVLGDTLRVVDLRDAISQRPQLIFTSSKQPACSCITNKEKLFNSTPEQEKGTHEQDGLNETITNRGYIYFAKDNLHRPYDEPRKGGSPINPGPK